VNIGPGEKVPHLGIGASCIMRTSGMAAIRITPV